MRRHRAQLQGRNSGASIAPRCLRVPAPPDGCVRMTSASKPTTVLLTTLESSRRRLVEPAYHGKSVFDELRPKLPESARKSLAIVRRLRLVRRGQIRPLQAHGVPKFMVPRPCRRLKRSARGRSEHGTEPRRSLGRGGRRARRRPVPAKNSTQVSARGDHRSARGP